MSNIFTLILSVIIVLVLLELFDLPDWIGRKLRGRLTKADLEKRISALETRLSTLENTAKPQ